MSRLSVQTLILLVDNEFGVLTRVTALVRREGWNIKSLSVAETMNPAVSRLTISVECIAGTMPHVLDRLGRLACVRGITAYSDATHFRGELVIATVSGPRAGDARDAAVTAGARAICCSQGCVTVEFSGKPEQVEELIALLKPFGAVNAARSGVVALEKPEEESK